MIPDLGPVPKTILFGVLNWGLGHASRSIPIIQELITQGHQLILASNGDALTLLKKEFPKLKTELLPAYGVKYRTESLWQIVISNSPNVYTAIRKEYRLAQKLVKKYGVDVIISDSRFGFRSRKVRSIIISHQLYLRSSNSFLQYGLNSINQKYLNAFDACWIPDEIGNLLSGELSQNPKISNQVFIGPVSRLNKSNTASVYDLALLLSGPEPARTKLEIQLIEKLKGDSLNICLVRGTTDSPSSLIPKDWKVIDLATSKEINETILKSRQVFSRSGYSSIMDYYIMGTPAFLLPTAGQSEQEYLAEFLDGKYGFTNVKSLEEWTISY